MTEKEPTFQEYMISQLSEMERRALVLRRRVERDSKTLTRLETTIELTKAAQARPKPA